MSRHAASLTLFLVRKSGPDNIGKRHLEIVLNAANNRTGDVWHVGIEGLKDLESMCYGWRAEGVLGADSKYLDLIAEIKLVNRTMLHAWGPNKLYLGSGIDFDCVSHFFVY